MRFSNTACLLAALSSASRVLADKIEAEATMAVEEAPEYIDPDAGSFDLIDVYGNHLDLRQVTVYNQQATQAATQAPAVTTFMMNKQIGATVTYAAIVYTQTFADVPDQLPSPIPGTIGLGNLVKQGGDGAKNKKREAQPTAGSPAVLEQEQVIVTFWQQPIKRVTEVVVIPVAVGDGPSTANIPETSAIGSPAWNPPYTWASSNRTNATITITATGTMAGTVTGTAWTTFPSQMDPAQQLPPYDDYRN